MAAPEHRAKWMRVDRLLGEHEIQEDSAAGRQEFERRMEVSRIEEEDEERLQLRGGVGVWEAKTSNIGRKTAPEKV